MQYYCNIAIIIINSFKTLYFFYLLNRIELQIMSFVEKIDLNNIINTSAVIEHGVKIGNNCHISTRTIINGDVEVQDNTFIGSGSVIREGVKIGKNCFISMGQVVKKNIPNNSVVR